MRQTLGTAVFSGMLGVTLFGIFLTPVFYYVIQWFSDRRGGPRRIEEDETEEEPAPHVDGAVHVGDGEHLHPAHHPVPAPAEPILVNAGGNGNGNGNGHVGAQPEPTHVGP